MAFTFFFRDQQVLERVVEHILPSLAGRSHPRIWDAGVAMGQEPYTLSIMFAERMGHFAFNNLRIDATDVESTGQFAQMIEAGLYPKEELSRLPEGILEKYFEPNGQPGYFRVIDKIRRRVVLSAARSSVVPGNRSRIFAGLVQERAAPLPAAGEDRSAQNVSPGAGAGRLLRHRADAGDAAGTRLAVRAGDSRRAVVPQSGGWRMRIVTLENSGQVYTSQVYLVLGGASRLEDVNTLVDVGQDPAILASIERAPTGVGKWPVEQVVLTHGHSDHCALLPRVREAFHPKVFAFSPNIDGVDGLLRDGDTIKMGDEDFEVIHTPGHSSDSICLYNEAEGVLFAGDSPVLITSPTGTYEAGVSGGIGEAVRPRCPADLLWARRSADGALQREAA